MNIFVIRRLIAVFGLASLSLLTSFAGVKKPKRVTTYLISVGVNDYSVTSRFANCESDATAFAHKIEQDCTQKFVKGSRRPFLGEAIHDSSVIHLLVGEKATLENLRSAFLEVIKSAKAQDDFVFFFAGLTREITPTETVIIPKLSYPFREDSLSRKDLLSVSELSGLMEQIACNNQLIVSESGVGSEFAKNLITHLFETNPHFAKVSNRNRIIISTNGFGADDYVCNGRMMGKAPLLSYMLRGPEYYSVFSNPRYYELELIKQEVICPVGGKKYFSIFQERTYRDLLLRTQGSPQSRGAVVKHSIDADSFLTDEAKTYAFIIATNEYTAGGTWSHLDNPVNDGKAVAKILREKYDVEVILLINQKYDDILDSMDLLLEELDSNDKLIYFVAGHGYYREKSRAGYLVFNDSKSFDEDPSLRHSYMQMATLRQWLNSLPCKQVLAIFDVCFGSSFEPSGNEIEAKTYNNLQMDKGLDEFILRKHKYLSRIFMASGNYEVPDYWDNSADHSPFASKIIKALEDEPAYICPGKLYSVLGGNATEPVLRTFGKHHSRADFLLKVSNF